MVVADADDWHEPFVREHILSLFRHVRLVYPFVSTTSTVVEVFRQVAATEPRPTTMSRAWLRQIARSVVYGDHPDSVTLRRNGAAIVIDLLDFVDSLDARRDDSPVVLALGTMEPHDQELLRMITVEVLSDDELAAILGISVPKATARRVTALARLQSAIDDRVGGAGGQSP